MSVVDTFTFRGDRWELVSKIRETGSKIAVEAWCLWAWFFLMNPHFTAFSRTIILCPALVVLTQGVSHLFIPERPAYRLLSILQIVAATSYFIWYFSAL